MTATLPPQEDFDDLDSLLAEAVEVAEARKLARKKGTRTPPAVAAIVREADAEMTWTPQFAIARFVETHCSCGASHRQFDGWFIVSQHKREPSSRRFLRSDNHHNLPAWQFTAQEDSSYCVECLEGEALPLAVIDQLLGLEALGQAATCCLPATHQQALDLFPPPQDQDLDQDLDTLDEDLLSTLEDL